MLNSTSISGRAELGLIVPHTVCQTQSKLCKAQGYTVCGMLHCRIYACSAAVESAKPSDCRMLPMSSSWSANRLDVERRGDKSPKSRSPMRYCGTLPHQRPCKGNLVVLCKVQQKDHSTRVAAPLIRHTLSLLRRLRTGHGSVVRLTSLYCKERWRERKDEILEVPSWGKTRTLEELSRKD